MRVDRVILKLEDTVRQILQALDKRLTFWDNWDAKQMNVIDSGAADTEFTIQHNLGRIPVFYWFNAGVACSVYDGDRNLWTPTTMTLKCSVPNAALSLLIM